MNKTENKTQAVDFSNIREMQNLIKSNGIGNLAASLKSFRQKLNIVGAKIVEVKKSAETKAVVKPSAPEPQEVKVKAEPVKVETKVEEVKTEEKVKVEKTKTEKTIKMPKFLKDSASSILETAK